MNISIETIRQTRNNLLILISDLSIEQLNIIPAGFNNNIIWNLGHIVAADQGVFYRRAGLPMILSDDFWAMYKPDSKPERFIEIDELENIKELMVKTIDRFEADLKTDLFDNYIPWKTRYGVDIHDINEALTFMPFHEGLHSGVMQSIKKLVLIKS